MLASLSGKSGLQMAEAALMAPILFALLIGALPALLPVLLYRKLSPRLSI